MLHGKCLHKSIRLVTFTIVKILVYTNHSNETATFTQSNRSGQDNQLINNHDDDTNTYERDNSGRTAVE